MSLPAASTCNGALQSDDSWALKRAMRAVMECSRGKGAPLMILIASASGPC